MALSTTNMQAQFKRGISNSTSFQRQLQQLIGDKNKSNGDKAIDMLREYYAKKQKDTSENLRKEFINNLKSKTYTRLQISKKDMAAKSGRNIKKTVDGQAKKEGASVHTASGQRQQILKAIYETVLEEYYDTKSKIDTRLANKSKINPSDKVYLEYLQYQKYLLKVDSMYKDMTGRFIANDDKDIREKEENMLRTDMKGEYKIEKVRGNSIERVDEIQNKIENLNNEIVELNRALLSDSVSPKEYEAKMQNLNEKLINENMALEHLNPTMEELRTMRQKEIDYEVDLDRNLGAYPNKKKNIPVEQISGRAEGEEQVNDEKQEKIVTEYHSSNLGAVNALIEMAQRALNNNNTEKAEQYIKQINAILATDGYSKKYIAGEEVQAQNDDSHEATDISEEDLQKYFDEIEAEPNAKNKGPQTFMEELKSGVRDKKEVLESELERLRGCSERMSENEKEVSAEDR